MYMYYTCTCTCTLHVLTSVFAAFERPFFLLDTLEVSLNKHVPIVINTLFYNHHTNFNFSNCLIACSAPFNDGVSLSVSHVALSYAKSRHFTRYLLPLLEDLA